MARSSGLGKGLSALISERKTISEMAEKTGKKEKIALSQIFPSRFQPRTIFDIDELAELSESIKRNGVLQPILVKARSAGRGYEIIAGERRWRASKQAGLAEIPAIILDIDDKQAMEIALIENIQRQNLKVLEEAEGYKRLIREFDYTQEQLADVIGKSRSYVTNVLRLTSLPDEVKIMLNEGSISTGHARAVLTAPDMLSAANEVVSKKLSVRQTENFVKKLILQETGSLVRKKTYNRKKKNNITDLDNSTSISSKDEKDEDIKLIEKQMTKAFGHEVVIENQNESGQVLIKYSNMQELNSILNKIEK